MKVMELTKQLSDDLGVSLSNKEVIDFLKSKEFKITSHMQKVTEEMITLATEYFTDKYKNVKKVENVESEKREKETVKTISSTSTSTKTFKPDDLIPCRSVTAWKLNGLGVDRVTIYHWNYFGDVDYVAYKDLQAWRRKDMITQPKIIIEDPDLCEQWKRELSEVYKPFLGVEYPEELFEKTDEEFGNMLRTSNDTVREVVKVTARNMINNENYPTVQKVNLIDEILGTCIKEFL